MRELSAPSCSVGALLRPGAAQCLFGVDADELAERHTLLEDLWHHAPARSLRDQLIDTRRGEDRLAVLEAALAARLPRLRSLHPAIASALAEKPGAWSVGDAVRRSGVSHRRYIALFQQAVGLPPKTWLRVQRFQQALSVLGQGAGTSLASLAADMGYSDQSHFNRDFRTFTGVTPITYRQRVGAEANHLPIGAGPVHRT